MISVMNGKSDKILYRPIQTCQQSERSERERQTCLAVFQVRQQQLLQQLLDPESPDQKNHDDDDCDRDEDDDDDDDVDDDDDGDKRNLQSLACIANLIKSATLLLNLPFNLLTHHHHHHHDA